MMLETYYKKDVGWHIMALKFIQFALIHCLCTVEPYVLHVVLASLLMVCSPHGSTDVCTKWEFWELTHWSLLLQVVVSFQDIAFPDGTTAEYSTSHILYNLSRWSKSSMAASFPMQVPHFHVVFLDNSVCHMLILHQTQIHNWESCSFA